MKGTLVTTDIRTPEDKLSKAIQIITKSRNIYPLYDWMEMQTEGDISVFLSKKLPNDENRTIADMVVDKDFATLNDIMYAIDLGYLSL